MEFPKLFISISLAVLILKALESVC